MVKDRPTLVEPPIEELIDSMGSKFKLAVIAGKRARQISLYYSSLGQSIKGLVPPQVASLSDKALTMAFEEIAAGKLVTRPAGEILEEEAAGEDSVGDNGEIDQDIGQENAGQDILGVADESLSSSESLSGEMEAGASEGIEPVES
ncbi:MAG: DNA-directed RNA polymerase subunit omega [Acidimicrobiales bacterium]